MPLLSSGVLQFSQDYIAILKINIYFRELNASKNTNSYGARSLTTTRGVEC